MTFDLEIMQRNDDRVFTEHIAHDRLAAEWTEADVDAILKKVLHAVWRLVDPAADPERVLNYRGVSWIVSPSHDGKGVVLALEVPSASAVAGPFDVPQAQLDRLVSRVVGGTIAAAKLH